MAAILYGLQVNIGAGVENVTGWGNIISQGETIKQQCDSKDITDSFGNVTTTVKYNQNQTMSLKSYFPAGYALMLGAGLSCTLSGTYCHTDIAGIWLIDSISKTTTVDDVATFELELSRPNFL
jgi:hypothetical protein